MRPSLRIRPYRPADIERIMEIERASFGSDAYDRNLFAGFFNRSGDLFLVAVGEDRIWGYLVASPGGRQSPQRAELISVAVDPAKRGRGVASSLMRSVLRRLRRRGIARFTLTVRESNDRARGFYKHYGFENVRRLPRYYHDGEDGLLLRKIL